MRVAVLSDIHANAPALEAVLAGRGQRATRSGSLGDIVGYGPHPDEVVARLREEGALAVQGNHDAAVLGRIPTGTFNAQARSCGRVDRRQRSPRPRGRGWRPSPTRRVEGDFTLVHGSPREPLWEYLISIPVARLNLAAFATPYCLVGHTHLPAHLP